MEGKCGTRQKGRVVGMVPEVSGRPTRSGWGRVGGEEEDEVGEEGSEEESRSS